MAYGNFYDSPLGRMLTRFYTKQGELPKDWQPFLMNRFLSMSFNKDIQKQSFLIDKYVFALYDKKYIMKALIDFSIPKHDKVPFTKYIKPTKDIQKYEEILKEFQRINHWTDKELNINTDLLLNILSDKTVLKKTLDSFGADVKLYRKFGFKIDKPKKEIKVIKTKSIFDFGKVV